MNVKPEEIPAVARLVHDLCGVVLDDSKSYLIDSRLGRMADAASCANFADFCLKARSSPTLQSLIADAITTQETLFFRDTAPFDTLQYKAIPEIIDAKEGTLSAHKLRIWSAACSTGQEPYSIAMTLCNLISDINNWDVRILATDISESSLMHASMGRYNNFDASRGLPEQMRSKYFEKAPGGWRVKEKIRYMIQFDCRNLLDPMTGIGPFDIIFCRNVAIYFDMETKRDLFIRLAERLTPAGYLFVGSSECLANLDRRFVAQHHCQSVFYQPNVKSALAVK
jgi:chemotaxis protein methyltransferase CheR